MLNPPLNYPYDIIFKAIGNKDEIESMSDTQCIDYDETTHTGIYATIVNVPPSTPEITLRPVDILVLKVREQTDIEFIKPLYCASHFSNTIIGGHVERIYQNE